mgnify:FL=1
MKKFRLRQEIDITEEDGTPLKTVSIDMWVSTEGISEEIINNMFKSLSDEFTRIIDEVNTDGERPEKIEFMSDDIRKGWQ